MQQFDVEKFFLSDIKEKKQETASLKAALKHKRLGKSSMKFATDLMSKKERKEHMKAGEVVTTNLYDTILTFMEFDRLETYEKKNMLQYWRSKYTIKEIMGAMGIANKKFYEIIDELELPKDRALMAKGKREGKPRKAPVRKTAPEAAELAIQSSLELEPAPVQRIIINGLNLEFNGTYEPEQIIKQLLKFGALLEGETDNYFIELKLMQKAK
jgi:replicative superfamily II helicase